MTRDRVGGSDREIAGVDRGTLAIVGRVARPHGLRGEVVVNPETDFPETRFAPSARLLMRVGAAVREVSVTSCRLHKGRPIVGLEGLETVEDAQLITGAELCVPVESLLQLPKGVYYQHDLVGCRVTTVGGTDVGEVTGVDAGGGGARLVVDGPRGEVLVPLAETICVEVDLAGRRVVIDPPEGLLELNVTAGRRRRER